MLPDFTMVSKIFPGTTGQWRKVKTISTGAAAIKTRIPIAGRNSAGIRNLVKISIQDLICAQQQQTSTCYGESVHDCFKRMMLVEEIHRNEKTGE